MPIEPSQHPLHQIELVGAFMAQVLLVRIHDHLGFDAPQFQAPIPSAAVVQWAAIILFPVQHECAGLRHDIMARVKVREILIICSACYLMSSYKLEAGLSSANRITLWR
jgi:hypothetical protein